MKTPTSNAWQRRIRSSRRPLVRGQCGYDTSDDYERVLREMRRVAAADLGGRENPPASKRAAGLTPRASNPYRDTRPIHRCTISSVVIVVRVFIGRCQIVVVDMVLDHPAFPLPLPSHSALLTWAHMDVNSGSSRGKFERNSPVVIGINACHTTWFGVAHYAAPVTSLVTPTDVTVMIITKFGYFAWAVRRPHILAPTKLRKRTLNLAA